MYEVYTDGSCLGNPGRGGWGAISEDFKLCGAQANTTNNVMEMTAIVKALEQCLHNVRSDQSTSINSVYQNRDHCGDTVKASEYKDKVKK